MGALVTSTPAKIFAVSEMPGRRSARRGPARLVPAAYTIAEMPYAAASEMAMLGAKVLHQQSVVPCEAQRIPLRIANTFEPRKPGTWLVAEPQGKPPAVWALTLAGGALVRRGSMA